MEICITKGHLQESLNKLHNIGLGIHLNRGTYTLKCILQQTLTILIFHLITIDVIFHFTLETFDK